MGTTTSRIDTGISFPSGQDRVVRRTLPPPAEQSLLPSFEAAVAEIHAFLTHVTEWVSPLDTAIDSAAPAYPPLLLNSIGEQLFAVVQPRLKELFEHFEAASREVPEDAQAFHREFARRRLHPLVLCSPFCNRAFFKPLGYAGDYESVNMIMRNRMEGPNIYAKLINAYFLRIDVSQGHRNRIDKLVDILQQERRRLADRGRALRVLSLGCGPAEEVQRFIRIGSESENCRFVLVDFNRETIEHARQMIEQAASETGRSFEAEFINRSVTDLLKEAAGRESAGAPPQYDLIYCAGLFDYLSNRVCARLQNMFCDWVAPGGLVVTTNVHRRHTSRAILEDLADWRLILRTEAEMLALAPAGKGAASVSTEPAGVNVIMEVRKPDDLDDAEHSRSQSHHTA